MTLTTDLPSVQGQAAARETAANNSAHVRDHETNPWGVLWLALAVLSAFPVFWFGLEKLPEEWMRPEFRLKPIVPFVSLLLFLQVSRSVPPATESDRTRWLGVALIAGSIMIAAIGNLVDIDDLVFVPLVPWIAGLILTTFGVRRGLLFWAPVASLFLMLPLPHFIVDPIQKYLADLTSLVGLDLLRILKVPALLEGRTPRLWSDRFPDP